MAENFEQLIFEGKSFFDILCYLNFSSDRTELVRGVLCLLVEDFSFSEEKYRNLNQKKIEIFKNSLYKLISDSSAICDSNTKLFLSHILHTFSLKFVNPFRPVNPPLKQGDLKNSFSSSSLQLFGIEKGNF